MDAIRLLGMRFEVYLGATDGEARRTQVVEVDVEVRADLAQAGRDDDLDATLDYGKVFDAVRAAIEGRRIRLIEAVAERAAQAALRCGAQDVVVRVRKAKPPVKGDLPVAEVEVHRSVSARADRS